MSAGAAELHALGVRSPAKRRGSLRPAASDGLLKSKSYGFLHTGDQAHPLVQRLRLEQRKLYDALISRMNNETRIAQVGLGSLRDISGLKKRSVRRARVELAALGLAIPEERWGPPGEHDRSGGGRRSRHLATRYYLPRLTDPEHGALIGWGTLLVGDGLDVDAEPNADDEAELDEEAVQEAARALAEGVLREALLAAQADLQARAEALGELAGRVGTMLTGRSLGVLRREAEERRIVAAVVAGREPPSEALKDTLRTRLEAVCGASCQGDPQRQRQPRAYQEALRARGRWSYALRATLGAAVDLGDVLAQIQAELPREGDWRKSVMDARLALYLAQQTATLAAEVEPALEAAEESWGGLPKGPPPRSLLRLTDARPELAPAVNLARHKPWEPPALWGQKVGDSPKRWMIAREAWRQAKANNNGKAMARLRRAGFREDWPDPPT